MQDIANRVSLFTQRNQSPNHGFSICFHRVARKNTTFNASEKYLHSGHRLAFQALSITKRNPDMKVTRLIIRSKSRMNTFPANAEGRTVVRRTKVKTYRALDTPRALPETNDGLCMTAIFDRESVTVITQIPKVALVGGCHAASQQRDRSVIDGHMRLLDVAALSAELIPSIHS